MPVLTPTEIYTRLQNAPQTAHHERPFPQHGGLPPRPAAVLIPLTQQNGEWHFLYTRRAETVEHHKGQVSFPGGATDPQDNSPEATALREADEEIGLRPADVQILGRLSRMLTITNFMVTPVAGIYPSPYPFQLHAQEVARAFTIPLRWLADRQNWQEHPSPLNGTIIITYREYEGEVVWGATARITVEFLRALGVVAPELTSRTNDGY
jgi:8-oxo-dGTP pyrophosphatase MutT (NUDIX family)